MVPLRFGILSDYLQQKLLKIDLNYDPKKVQYLAFNLSQIQQLINKQMDILTSKVMQSTETQAKDKDKNIAQQIDRVHIKLLTNILNLITTIFTLLYKFILIPAISLVKKIVSKKKKISHIDFHQRKYESSIDELQIQQKHIGLTNRVLVQNGGKTINFYLPVYITNKIKSIQDVSASTLTGNVSCALIINVFYGELPDQIVEKLSTDMVIQLNRGEAIKLENDLTISVKNDKKYRFLIFTIRKVFLAMLVENTLWSPFELIQLVISLTLNTVTIAPQKNHKKLKTQNSRQKDIKAEQSDAKQTGYDPSKQYKISFNCMRNSEQIPMSYALDCVFGIYDLAEQKLQSYHSQYSTYSQILRAYHDHEDKEYNKQKNINQKQHHSKLNQDGSPISSNQLVRFTRQFANKLRMRTSNKKQIKQAHKVKYFQYTHFVIPLYKYPGNFIATIFIPIFILALVSLAIFFQDPNLQGRIGAIATMVLGYIALIPSIKQRLPPSSNITIIECVVYIETICCLLCLLQSFMVRSTVDSEYIFIWYESIYFIACLCIHIGTFFFIMGIFIVHKLIWQPGYNSQIRIKQIKPYQNSQQWDNPYCDEAFVKFNSSIEKNQSLSAQQKQESRIVEYHNPIKEKEAAEFKKDKILVKTKESQLQISETTHFISRNSLLSSNTFEFSSKNIPSHQLIKHQQDEIFEEPFKSQTEFIDSKMEKTTKQE